MMFGFYISLLFNILLTYQPSDVQTKRTTSALTINEIRYAFLSYCNPFKNQFPLPEDYYNCDQ